MACFPCSLLYEVGDASAQTPCPSCGAPLVVHEPAQVFEVEPPPMVPTAPAIAPGEEGDTAEQTVLLGELQGTDPAGTPSRPGGRAPDVTARSGPVPPRRREPSEPPVDSLVAGPTQVFDQPSLRE